MKKEGFRRFVSVQLIFLIIMLPVSIAQSATGIDQDKSYAVGQDGIPGFFRADPSERITLTVVAKIQNENVTVDKVGIRYDNADYTYNCCTDFCKLYGEPTCVKLPETPVYGTNAFNCTCVENFNEQMSFQFFIKDDSGTIKDRSRTIQLLPEELPPQVQLLDVKQLKDNTTISFTMNDTACSARECRDATRPCAGVSKIDVLNDGVLVDEISIDELVCRTKTISDYEVSGLTGDGTHRICLKAYDRMHHGGSDPTHESELSCITKDMDFTEPAICPDGSFKVMVRGEEVTHFSNNNPQSEFPGLLEFTINEQNLSSVVVDAHELNINPLYSKTDYYLNYLTLDASRGLRCIKKNGLYTCTVPISINPSKEKPEITVKATNHLTLDSTKKCVDKNLLLDNEDPSVEFLGTDHCDAEGICYLNDERNTVFSLVKETKSGMDLDYFFMDVTKLKTDPPYGNIQVVSCDKSGSLWRCYTVLKSTLQDGQSARFSVIPPSMDDARNPMTGRLEASLVMDRTDPVKHGVILVEDRDAGYPYLVTGANARITLFVNDSGSGVKEAVLDTSPITTPGGGSVGVCEGTGNPYRCVFEVASVEGPKTNTVITFNVTDFAGNTATVSDRITISGTSDDEKQFWRVGKPVYAPNKVSRRDMELASQRIFVQLPLKKTTASNPEILHLELPRCSGQLAQAYIDEKQLLNDQRGSTNPVIRFDLKQTAEGVNPEDIPDLTFTCDIEIITKVGTTVYPMETVSVNLTIGLIDYPFGNLPANVAEEIERVKHNTLNEQDGFYGEIMKMKKTLDWMQKVCGTYSVLSGIYASLTTTTSILKTAAEAFPPLETAAEIVARGTETHEKTTRILGWTLGIPCAVASCKLPKLIMDFAKVPQGVSKVYQDFLFRDPQQSLSTSWATLCLPGIIYNLEKARQIECKYASCLKHEVPAGENVYTCMKSRELDWCIYVYQQESLKYPLTGLINYALEAAALALRNPLNLGFAIYQFYCDRQPDPAKWYCKVPNAISNLNSALNYIRNFKNYWSQPKDYCQEVFSDE